jgi:hypothetical protein
LGKLIDEHLSDTRQGDNKKFPLADLLRQSVYSRLAGYEDLNDAVRVSADPTFRLLGSKKNWDRGVALTSRRQSFETGMLAGDENLIGLMAVNRELIAQAEATDDSERVVLDLDSTESPVHGRQEGSAYNGHYESMCYHPLLLFNQHGGSRSSRRAPPALRRSPVWRRRRRRGTSLACGLRQRGLHRPAVRCARRSSGDRTCHPCGTRRWYPRRRSGLGLAKARAWRTPNRVLTANVAGTDPPRSTW